MRILRFLTRCSSLIYLATALLVNETAAGTEGPQRITLRDAARQLGADRIGEYIPAQVLDSFSLPTKEEWRRFWTGVQGALRSGDLEELAWMRPEAEQALLVLDSINGGKPYADWLRQRLDYFEVADSVTGKIPARPRPVRPSSTPPPRTHQAEYSQGVMPKGTAPNSTETASRPSS